MTEEAWPFLDRVLEALRDGKRLPAGFQSSLIDRLDTALADGGGKSLYAAQEYLARVVQEVLRLLPQEAADAVRGAAADGGPTSAAFTLGQIGFAQALSARLYERRADPALLDILGSSAYAPYVQALLKSDQTGKQLTTTIGEREETVSRKLRKLREVRAVDSQRDGQTIVNYLTPVAREALAGLKQAIPADQHVARKQETASSRAIEAGRRMLPQQLRSSKTLGAVASASAMH